MKPHTKKYLKLKTRIDKLDQQLTKFIKKHGYKFSDEALAGYLKKGFSWVKKSVQSLKLKI